MAQNQNHIGGVNFTKLSIRRQDNSHHSINIMISTSYHLVANPPISWQKPSEALAWLAAWCPYSDIRWFVLIRFLLFPEGRLEDTELSQKFSPFFKLQRWFEKKLVERGRSCTRLLWLMRPLCHTWICGAFLSDFFTNLGDILTICKINICLSLTQLQWAMFNIETCGLSDDR